MAHTAITRLPLYVGSLYTLLLAPNALAETENLGAYGAEALGAPRLTDKLVVQGDPPCQLIALQQEDEASGSSGTDDAGKLDDTDEEVSESRDGWVEGGQRFAARKADEMTQWVD